MRSTISRARRSTAWSRASGPCRGRRGWRCRWCARCGGDSDERSAKLPSTRLPAPGTGLPGRHPGGVARRRRCRRRRGLLRPAERDQCAQFSRIEFHGSRSRAVARLCARPQRQATTRGQHLSAGRQVRAVARRDRRRSKARRRRSHSRRHGRGRLRRAQLSGAAAASVGAGLPRMLTVAEIAELHRQIPCEIEAFIFGNIGMMTEGRCSLSSYVTGASTNMDGVCSPAADVHYEEDAARNLTTRLGEYVIDCFAGGESAGYPTICKGRYLCGVQSYPYYAFEEPVSLNLSALLPDLMRAGVTALKIEGRQRSRAYVKTVVSAFRKAVDDLLAGREAAL